jgi:hypothetical protein
MKILVVFFIAFSFATASNAQSSSFFVEERNVYTKDHVTPSGFMQANHYFKDSKYGTFIYVSLSQGWGEMIAGGTKTYTLKNNGLVEVGLGGGIETGQKVLRGATYIFTIINLRKDGKFKLTGLVNGEYGGSGYWYIGFITTNITPKFALGVHAQYGAVWGPRLQYKTKNFMLWGAIGKNIEADSFGAVTGIRLAF